MPDLPERMFGEAGVLPLSEYNRCWVNGEDSIVSALSQSGWNGGAVCYILLNLSPDNLRVDRGRFAAKGLEERDLSIAASKIWQDADININLTVRMPSMESFIFGDGGLTSYYLDSKEIVHFFHKVSESGAQTPILSANIKDFGLGDFCIRLVCNVTSSSGVRNGVRIKYHVLLFPLSAEGVKNISAATQSPSWPGIRLGEGEMPLLPKSKVQWGCPVMPLLQCRVQLSDIAHTPKAADLRFAISEIMQRSGAPDAQKNAAATTAKWEKLAQDFSKFRDKPAPFSWPKSAAPEPLQGIIR